MTRSIDVVNGAGGLGNRACRDTGRSNKTKQNRTALDLVLAESNHRQRNDHASVVEYLRSQMEL
jgi:hypothetical protein